MNQDELKFRQDLMTAMAKYWSATIHVENHLNPGVPDLSYVMRRLKSETGWLELKVSRINPATENTVIHVERGQHSWMKEHAERIPAHFLILIGGYCYLVDGGFHDTLDGVLHIQELRDMARDVFSFTQITDHLPRILTELTDRTRRS